jgi:hypothetical protein
MARNDITVFFHPHTLGAMVEEGRIVPTPEGNLRFSRDEERYAGLFADSSDEVEEGEACRQVITYEPWA